MSESESSPLGKRVVEKIPGFNYSPPMGSPHTAETVWEDAMHYSLFLPFEVIGAAQPTNAVTWVFHGVVLIAALCAWLPVGLCFLLVALVAQLLTESYQDVRER